MVSLLFLTAGFFSTPQFDNRPIYNINFAIGRTRNISFCFEFINTPYTSIFVQDLKS